MTTILWLNLLWTSAAKAETLPCLNSSPQCIEQLASKAIANSPTLAALSEQVTLTDRREAVLSEHITYISQKHWTNYLTFDPTELVQNLFGGGGVARDKAGIAQLEMEKTNLRGRRASIQKRQEQVKRELTGQILALVQQYEAAAKHSAMIWSQLETLRVQQQVAEIEHRQGTDATQQLLALKQQQQILGHQLFQQQVAQEQAQKRVLVLTGGFAQSTPESSGGEPL